MSNTFDRDEQISAYLDGEMTGAARAAFERDVESDPALRRRVEEFRALNAELAATLQPKTAAPATDALLRSVRVLAAAQGAAAQENVVPLQARRFIDWQLPIAAAIALVVGGGLVYGLVSGGRQLSMAILDNGQVAPGSALHAALERQQSGEAIAAGADARVRPVLTFQAKDGRYCREFESFDRAAAVVGVACRAADVWKVEVLLAARVIETNGGYAPASGYNAHALDDVVRSLMQDQAFDAERERDVIERRWPPAQPR
jgi:anti-sigma-K factor RskA